jgi:arylsulfatase A-like enzyme
MNRLILLCAAVAVLGTSCSSEAKRPNVLFIAVDDLSDWTSVLKGHPQARTPNLDRLAARGLSFTNAHAPAPTCGPSRASLMTSIRPSTSGNYENSDTFTGNPLLNRALSLPELFQRGGYQVTGAGKLFHGHHFKTELKGRGFDVYWPSKENDHYKEPQARARPKPMADWGQGENTFWDWGPMAPHITLDDMSDGRMVNWVREQLRSGAIEEPFFLAVGIIRPHLPFYAPQSYFDQFPIDSIELPEVLEDDLADVPLAGRTMGIGESQHEQITSHGQWKTAVQAYLATSAFADDCVGRVLEGLEESGYADNTIVVLWSDHGWQFGEKKHWAKFTLWERATRVNLIFAGPGIAQGKSSGAPVNLLDLYPTLADLTGLELPENQIEGRALTPLLSVPERDWPFPSITTYGYMNHAVRDRHWRYIRYRDGSEELYDHRNDPREWTNLAHDPAHLEVLASFASALPATNAQRIEGLSLPRVRALP